MGINFDFSDKLDFADIDLTPPEKVIEEIAAQFEQATKGLVCVRIEGYDGHIFSYKQSFAGIANMLADKTKDYDIQNDLGKLGEETHKYEVCLYTPLYENYKFRVFFLKYGVASYPVTLVLEQSVAKSIKSSNYILSRDDRTGLECLVEKILNSDAVLEIVQEMIRVNQIRREQTMASEDEI